MLLRRSRDSLAVLFEHGGDRRVRQPYLLRVRGRAEDPVRQVARTVARLVFDRAETVAEWGR